LLEHGIDQRVAIAERGGLNEASSLAAGCRASSLLDLAEKPINCPEHRHGF
jgi:hypothetical protein